MIYSKYISDYNRANGAPHLNSDQFARLMNIVSIENRLLTLNDQPNSKKVFHDIIQLEYSLERLTNNIEPAELLREMHNRSID